MARKKEPSTEQMDRSHFANAQAQFLDKIEATNRRWFERMQSEATFASEFASKLTNYGALHPRCYDCLPGLGQSAVRDDGRGSRSSFC